MGSFRSAFPIPIVAFGGGGEQEVLLYCSCCLRCSIPPPPLACPFLCPRLRFFSLRVRERSPLLQPPPSQIKKSRKKTSPYCRRRHLRGESGKFLSPPPLSSQVTDKGKRTVGVGYFFLGGTKKILCQESHRRFGGIISLFRCKDSPLPFLAVRAGKQEGRKILRVVYDPNGRRKRPRQTGGKSQGTQI